MSKQTLILNNGKAETTEDVRRLCTTELAPGQKGGPVADKTYPRGQVLAGLRNLVEGRARSLQPRPALSPALASLTPAYTLSPEASGSRQGREARALITIILGEKNICNKMNLMSPVYKEHLEINKKSGQRVWGLKGDLSQNTRPLTCQTELLSRTCRTRGSGKK